MSKKFRESCIGLSLKIWCAKSKFRFKPILLFTHKLHPNNRNAIQQIKRMESDEGRSFYAIKFNWLYFEAVVYLPIETTPIESKLKHLDYLVTHYDRQINGLKHKRGSCITAIKRLTRQLNNLRGIENDG